MMGSVGFTTIRQSQLGRPMSCFESRFKRQSRTGQESFRCITELHAEDPGELFQNHGWSKDRRPLGKASCDKNWVQLALLSWANDGSHSAPSDVSFAGMQLTNRAILETFKGIFDETGHEAHYNMMMQEAGEIAGFEHN